MTAKEQAESSNIKASMLRMFFRNAICVTAIQNMTALGVKPKVAMQIKGSGMLKIK